MTIEDGSENATRRQLVQVLLRDVLRRSGVPSDWVECHMLPVSSRKRGHGMYVRLVMRHWDPRFVNYAFAFQKTLLTDIERFDPESSSWLYGISWQFDVEGSCPYTAMPERSFWKQPVQTVHAPAVKVRAPVPKEALVTSAVAPPQNNPDEIDDPKTDLERLFAIRDQELNRHAVGGLSPVGYESTQSGALR